MIFKKEYYNVFKFVTKKTDFARPIVIFIFFFFKINNKAIPLSSCGVE